MITMINSRMTWRTLHWSYLLSFMQIIAAWQSVLNSRFYNYLWTKTRQLSRILWIKKNTNNISSCAQKKLFVRKSATIWISISTIINYSQACCILFRLVCSRIIGGGENGVYPGGGGEAGRGEGGGSCPRDCWVCVCVVSLAKYCIS